MHTKIFLLILFLAASSAAFSADSEESDFEALDRYMFPMRKATADLEEKYKLCEKIESEKPPLKVSDISFLKQRQALLMLLRAQRLRTSACIYPEVNTLIRKHIELLTFFRAENLFPAEVERLEQSLDLYYGLEGNYDRRSREEYGLIPKDVRERFEQVIKDKGLKINVFEITASLPE